MFPNVSDVSQPPSTYTKTTDVKKYAKLNLSAKAVPKAALPARPMTQLENFQWNTDLKSGRIALVYTPGEPSNLPPCVS